MQSLVLTCIHWCRIKRIQIHRKWKYKQTSENSFFHWLLNAEVIYAEVTRAVWLRVTRYGLRQPPPLVWKQIDGSHKNQKIYCQACLIKLNDCVCWYLCDVPKRIQLKVKVDSNHPLRLLLFRSEKRKRVVQVWAQHPKVINCDWPLKQQTTITDVSLATCRVRLRTDLIG